MCARPKKENPRDIQYTVRLTDEENDKLEFVCSNTGLSKSDIMRNALDDVFAKVNLQQFESERTDDNDDIDWDDDHISLKRVVLCPYCQKKNRIDFSEYCECSSDERQMGDELLYEFDFEFTCEVCDKTFHLSGYFSEYPVGALNDEDIRVEYSDDEDDFEEPQDED